MSERDGGPEVIHTAGLGARSPEVLLDLLRRARVRCVVDVRRYPTAARHPHHGAAALHAALREAGFEVHAMGDLLGGDRRGGFPRWMTGPAFARGLARLETLARGAPTLILCAERDPDRCHRRYIAGALESRGWVVAHHLATPAERAAAGALRLLRARA